MAIEVEQKFVVADLHGVAERLAAMGAGVREPQAEADVYYRHPARDFASTDEALRIRRKGAAAYLTYKGPKLDATTKTRREIDLPLAQGAADVEEWESLLEALGFTPVTEVRKRRRKALVDWEGRRVEVSLDEVEEVGTFVELEVVTTPDDVGPARDCIAALAAHLGLSANERRSYLELLLAKRGEKGP
jgi:adenylate cyclase class 2